MASEGVNTPQYQAVLQNIKTIVSALIATPGATDSLRMNYVGNGLLEITAEVDAKGLVTQALNRIKDGGKAYDEFIAMLKEIAGMDLTVTKLEGQ